MAGINLDPVTNAGGKAAAAGGNIMDQLYTVLNDPLTLGAVGLAIGLPFIGAFLYKLFHDDEQEFEKKPLKQIVRPKLVKVAERFGYTVKTTLKHDHHTLGEVYRMARFTEKSDLHNREHTPDIEYELDDDVKRALLDNNIYSEEQIQEIESGEIPHWLLVVRPNDVIGKLTWFFVDKVAGMKRFTEYFLVPQNLLVDAGKYLMVDKFLQFRWFAGVYIPLKFESMGIINSIVYRSLYETALEDQANYHKQVNYFSSQHSQNLQELEKEIEAAMAQKQGKMQDLFD